MRGRPGWRRVKRRLVTVIVGLAVLLWLGAGVSVVWPVAAPTPMAIIAHRGDLTAWPANTLEGVLAASRTEVDGIEFDVRQSKDGTWWLFHDRYLDLATTGTGQFRGLTDSQLAALTIDGGPGFSGQQDVGLTRLAPVLDALGAYRGALIVDVKEGNTPAHANIARLVAGRPDSYVICRSIAGASAVKSVDPGVTTVMLANEVWHSDVDVFLADARTLPAFWQSTWTDLGGTLAMYVNVDIGGEQPDERAILNHGRRWGVAFVITNRVNQALALRP